MLNALSSCVLCGRWVATLPAGTGPSSQYLRKLAETMTLSKLRSLDAILDTLPEACSEETVWEALTESARKKKAAEQWASVAFRSDRIRDRLRSLANKYQVTKKPSALWERLVDDNVDETNEVERTDKLPLKLAVLARKRGVAPTQLWDQIVRESDEM